MTNISDPLYLAIVASDLVAAQLAIGDRSDIALTRIKGESLLRIAGRSRNLSIGRLLIDHGADVNEVIGVRRNTLLHHAVASSNYGLASWLLELGADASPTNYSMATPLHFAARMGQGYLVRRLIQAGAELDAQDSQGRSPLQLAIDKGHSNIAEILTSSGAGSSPADRRSHSAHSHVYVSEPQEDKPGYFQAKLHARTDDKDRPRA